VSARTCAGIDAVAAEQDVAGGLDLAEEGAFATSISRPALA
jgi:hypothetical protein